MTTPPTRQLPNRGQNNLWYHEAGADTALVFVHGVLSDSRGCWLNQEDEARTVYWPELVARDPRLRGIDIFLGGYYTAVDSGPYEVRHCADELGRALQRKDVYGRRPVMERETILFVAHSTGGIVVRYLLESRQQDFADKKVGLVLVASPSYGSKDADRLCWLVDSFRHRVGAQLRWGSWSLQDLDDRFRNLLDDRRIPGLEGVEAYEHHFILHSRWLKLMRKQVVTKESAGRYFGAPVLLPGTNHFSAVKPGDFDHPAHLLLLDFLVEKELLPEETARSEDPFADENVELILRELAAKEEISRKAFPAGKETPGTLGPGNYPGSYSRGGGPVEEEPLLLPEDSIPEPGPLPEGSRMPLRLGENFVGREQAFRDLARALNAGSAAAIGQVHTAAATGMGGIGKTRLASQFVYRYGRYFPGGVFWLSFAEPEGIAAEIALCGGPEGMALADDFNDLPLEEQVQQVLEAWRGEEARLLVFDNCEDPELLDAWAPRRGGARILVTSRRDRWPPGLGVSPLPLSELPRAESVRLLLAFRPDLRPDDPRLPEIAAELGDLPLALELAGSFLRVYRHDPPGEPGAYLEALGRGDLLDHPSLQGYAKDRSLTGHERHVGKTFALSYDRLDPEKPVDTLAQALFLRACLFAPGEPIPRWLLLATVEGEEAWEDEILQADALARLGELGLVRLDEKGEILVHRLVATFGQAQDGMAEALAAVEEAMLKAARATNQKGLPGPLLQWQGQLRFVTERAAEAGKDRGARLCNELFYHLWQVGELSQARPFAEQALEIRKKTLGKEHSSTAKSLNNLGSLLQAQGDLSSAKPYYERALEIRERVLGEKHPDTALSLYSLGVLLDEQGDLSAAKAYYERALEIFEAKLGADHPNTRIVRGNLENLLQQL